MRHNLIGAPGVASRIAMKGVGEIPAKDRPQLPVDELADSIWSAEDTDIRMRAHDQHVNNIARPQQVVEFLSVIGDRILRRDTDCCDLPGPHGSGIPAGLRGVAGARAGMDERRRKVPFSTPIPAIPVGRAWWRHVRRRSGAGTHRSVAVKIHAATRRVDDQRALRSQIGNDRVHAVRHRGDALGGRNAMVIIPHVADDYGSPSRRRFIGGAVGRRASVIAGIATVQLENRVTMLSIANAPDLSCGAP